MSEGTSAGLDVNGFARGPVASVPFTTQKEEHDN
jgi:hypothetical protein